MTGNIDAHIQRQDNSSSSMTSTEHQQGIRRARYNPRVLVLNIRAKLRALRHAHGAMAAWHGSMTGVIDAHILHKDTSSS